MNALQEETVTVLHGLIAICRDSQEGFRMAAEYVADDPELKSLFNSFSLQRARFAGELETQAINLGDTRAAETEGGSVIGGVQRAWQKLKAAVTRADNHAILAECERGEDSAMEAYTKTLQHDLPDNVRRVVERQKQEIVSTHNTVRALRDATPAMRSRVMEAAHESVRAASTQVSQAAGSVREALHETKAKAHELQRSTKTLLRRNPLPALVAALATGFTIGMVFHAMELRNERAELLALRRRPLQGLGRTIASWFGYAAGSVRSRYGVTMESAQDIARRFPIGRRTPAERFTDSLKEFWNRITMSAKGCE